MTQCVVRSAIAALLSLLALVPGAGAQSRPDKEVLVGGAISQTGRFAEPALLILVSLVDGPKHGYAITDDIEVITGVRFGPGTLYGAIARLESRGLIERLKSDDHRNPYRLTATGEQALRARLASLEVVARTARRRLSHA